MSALSDAFLPGLRPRLPPSFRSPREPSCAETEKWKMSVYSHNFCYKDHARQTFPGDAAKKQTRLSCRYEERHLFHLGKFYSYSILCLGNDLIVAVPVPPTTFGSCFFIVLTLSPVTHTTALIAKSTKLRAERERMIMTVLRIPSPRYSAQWKSTVVFKKLYLLIN